MKWPQPRQLKDRVSTAFPAMIRFVMEPSDKLILCSAQVYILLLDLPCVHVICQSFGVTPLLADFLVLESLNSTGV